MSTIRPMVGQGSARDVRSAAGGEPPPRQRRALARCRRALERGRPVRGRRIVAGDEGLLLDLRGVLGHVPASEANERPPTRGVLGPVRDRWEGWVVAVADDLVHLCAQRPGERADVTAVRRGEVVSSGTSGARVRLEGETSLAVLPWEELSWEPLLEPPSLAPGTQVTGRVVGLTLGGPVLSPRSATPSPWPAIALALAPGSTVHACVEARTANRALLRTVTAPRAAAIVSAERLPSDAGPGTALEVTVVRVNAAAGALELDGISPGPRAPRLAPAAPTPERRGPGQAASGSRS